MKTAFLLAAQYNGAPLIDINRVRQDYFSELANSTFIRKLEDGSIPLPFVRLNGSQKGQRMIPLIDLAAYIDERAERARRELGRK